MAARRTARRRRAQPKQNRGKKAAVWAAVIAVFVIAAVIVIANVQSSASRDFRKLSYPLGYSGYVNKAARDYDLEPELIYAVIRTESGFEPDAESGAGARGVMQMMPSSFEWLMQQRGTEGQYTADDLYDPAVCIDYGSYLLKYFYDYYGNERCAVAAYNAGFAVSDWLADPAYSPDGVTLEAIPYPETEEYVERVESAKQQYIEIYGL